MNNFDNLGKVDDLSVVSVRAITLTEKKRNTLGTRFNCSQ